MNARIKKLAEQAEKYAEYVTPQGLEWFPIYSEQFAELIIKECINIMNNSDGDLDFAVYQLEKLNERKD